MSENTVKWSIIVATITNCHFKRVVYFFHSKIFLEVYEKFSLRKIENSPEKHSSVLQRPAGEPFISPGLLGFGLP